MAMATAGAGRKGGRGRRRGANKPMSEINVTPMVDVMLVLLIVFMVAAPLMTVGVAIDLPETQAQQLNTEQKPITVSVTPDGAVFIGDQPVALEALVSGRCRSRRSTAPRTASMSAATPRANYGAVMKVMGVLSSAGYSRIGLITDQEPQGQ